MRFFASTPIVLTLLGTQLAILPDPALAGQVTYTLAQVGGRMNVRTLVSTSWPFGTDTANAEAGVQINGTPGGSFTGSTGVLPVWSGTLGANGTTLTPSATNAPGAPAPTASSLDYFPRGFWAANQVGGTIKIPTAGYFNVVKNTGNAAAILSNTIGNATARASASWTFVPGLINNDWDGVESARVAMVNPAGAAIPANTRAVSNVSDPLFFYLPVDDEPLTFQVSLSSLIIDIEGILGGTETGQFADAYYRWTVMFGEGEVPGEHVLLSEKGGEDFFNLGISTPNPGTIVNYSNSTLEAGVYWMTADLNLGAEIIPEPGSCALLVLGLAGLCALRGNASRGTNSER